MKKSKANKISKHIFFKEATHSNYAKQYGIKNVPSDEDIENMKLVAEKVFESMCREEFLILPHPKVQKYLINKVSDYDRWIDGMRKLKRKSISQRGSAKPLDILHLV